MIELAICLYLAEFEKHTQAALSLWLDPASLESTSSNFLNIPKALACL